MLKFYARIPISNSLSNPVFRIIFFCKAWFTFALEAQAQAQTQVTCTYPIFITKLWRKRKRKTFTLGHENATYSCVFFCLRYLRYFSGLHTIKLCCECRRKRKNIKTFGYLSSNLCLLLCLRRRCTQQSFTCVCVCVCVYACVLRLRHRCEPAQQNYFEIDLRKTHVIFAQWKSLSLIAAEMCFEICLFAKSSTRRKRKIIMSQAI